MATALQQQLAAIAANSTHQLDLKAQKARHSKSLLFEPRDAATQSFDTIYQACYEGFEELCVLDSQFTPFGRNLFSEQSKFEDRTRMNAKENEELDQILESFLGLICGRLLLKPAIKAVEWLVRRFQVQDYNTQDLLLTFLPYHTSHIFPVVLSILPDQLPPSFRFLHPYVSSLQCPPRHAILSAAISNHPFFSAFSRYALRVSQARHHSVVLLCFWASITAQAVNGMIDASRSGRDNIRKQREEDLLLRVLPILQTALSIKGIPELYLGACMIATILATKASLQDEALDALLEAVAGACTDETLSEGIQCLAVIAEEKDEVLLPVSVVRVFAKFEKALSQLIQLGKSQRTSKLVAALAIGLVNQARRKHIVANFTLVEKLLRADVLPDQHTVVVLQSLVSSFVKLRETDASSGVLKAVSDLLTTFTEEPDDMQLLEMTTNRTGIDIRSLQLVPVVGPKWPEEGDEPEASEDLEITPEEPGGPSEFDLLLQTLPRLPIEATSFLESQDVEVFNKYAHTFHVALTSSQNTDRFKQVPQLHQSDPINRPESLTFLARLWSSNATATAKVTALDTARHILEYSGKESRLDLQALLPYVLTALSDSSWKVRSAGGDVCHAMNAIYGSNGRGSWMCPATNIYGDGAAKVHWLTSEDAQKFLWIAVLPVLPECNMDSDHITRALADAFNHGAANNAEPLSKTGRKELKKSLRSDACTFLASHAVSTPVMRVKLLLLQIVSKVGKAASHARSHVLLPFVKSWTGQLPETIRLACAAEKLDISKLDAAVIRILTIRSRDEMQMLKDIVSGVADTRNEVLPLTFERLRTLFPVSQTWQVELADFLFELALGGVENNTPSIVQDEALNTLRALAYPAEILVHIIGSLPNANDLQDQPPSTKKQRTSRTDTSQPRDVDQNKLNAAIRKITVVLEIVGGSKPERHPQILRGLFHVLSELHHYKALLSSELVYIHQLLLECMLAVVKGLNVTPTADIDRSVIRADLIVECVRTTSSTHVHNTALLLVSSLASWAPEHVLHNVMPLFTFMSSTVLRQSDSFSTHVTDQTVAQIVPALAASLKRKGKNLVSGVAELLLSFTAAFEHIPLHRRPDLFEHLVTTLGEDETLFAVIAMLIERYPDDPKVLVFVANLMNKFGAMTTMKTAEQYLDLVVDALKPTRGLSETLLLLNDQNEDEILGSVQTLFSGLAHVLHSAELRKRLTKALTNGGEVAASIHSLYASLLEKTMLLNQDLALNSALHDAAGMVLLAVLGLTPTIDFIRSSARLMQTGSDQTRQQVFRSLESRVAQAKRSDAEARRIFIDVLPNCSVFIREDQPIATRHAAVSCIDQISEKYGKTDRTAILNVAERVAGGPALGSDDPSLRVISILCLTSMVEVLEDDCIPILPSIITQTIAHLEANTNAESYNVGVVDAGFGLLNAVLDYLPWMLAPVCLNQALILADQTDGVLEIISDPVQHFLKLVAIKIAASELFPAIERTWSRVYDLGPKAMKCHLNILHLAIEHNSKATIMKNSRILFNILLEAFDLRRQFSPSDTGNEHPASGANSDDIHSALFELVDTTALDAVLKLNDASFRPFFVRVVEWATRSLPQKDAAGRTLRTTSLYSFSLTLFEQLKSIVTTYASFLLDSVSHLLSVQPASQPTNGRLQDLVLRTLSSSFRNDQDDFWQTPAHFDAVAVPLINQLNGAKDDMDQIILTITDLAGAVHSSEHHKTMNTAIMSIMRHVNAANRLAAVKCERSITERVNIEWLALLPEMLPVISELQEDDDEDVERETLRWVKQIEDVTGESLEGMLA